MCRLMKKKSGETKKCIFLDRDGTINKNVHYMYSTNQLELEENAASAIAEINDSEYLAIIITNQSAVARGMCSIDAIYEIHKKLETLLLAEHVYVDDIFFCPHHPDKNNIKGNSLYQIDCECRKPKPGMLFNAAEKFNIDLSQSYMVGDDLRDINAGIAAGCIPVFLTNDKSDNCLESINKLITHTNLKEFSDSIFNIT